MRDSKEIVEDTTAVSQPTETLPRQAITAEAAFKKSAEPDRKVKLDAFDHTHLYVGNAFQAMHLLRTTFGFEPIAYLGLETGSRDRVSYVLKQSNITVVVTSAVDSASDIAAHVSMHGDAVKEIAFTVPNAEEAFHLALCHGAHDVADPDTTEDAYGRTTTAAIHAFGDVIHRFVERKSYTGPFLPGYQALRVENCHKRSYLTDLDHVAMSFPEGELGRMTEFYTHILDMELTHQENVMTKHSGMNSKVVQNSNGNVRFPMMEPIAGNRRSQIDEFLKYNNGPGIQHLAFAGDDLVGCIRAFRTAGAEFLKTPSAYYEMLPGRVGSIAQEVADLQDCNMLADRDDWGYLLQIFSKPITARPTLFLEFIQRAGARGFGSGNIRALFDAVEREQALRGNL